MPETNAGHFEFSIISFVPMERGGNDYKLMTAIVGGALGRGVIVEPEGIGEGRGIKFTGFPSSIVAALQAGEDDVIRRGKQREYFIKKGHQRRSRLIARRAARSNLQS